MIVNYNFSYRAGGSETLFKRVFSDFGGRKVAFVENNTNLPAIINTYLKVRRVAREGNAGILFIHHHVGSLIHFALACWTGMTIVVFIHGPANFFISRSWRMTLRRQFFLQIVKFLSNTRSCTVVVPTAEMEGMALLGGMTRNVVKVLPYGPIDQICPQEVRGRRWVRNDKWLKVMMISTVAEHKGLELLPDLLSKINTPVCVDVFGEVADKQLAEKVLEESKMLKGHSVNFRGVVDLSKEIYCDSDLVLHLSFAEGLSLALVEAASYGIPIVARAATGVSHFVFRVGGAVFETLDEAANVVNSRSFERTDSNKMIGHEIETYRKKLLELCG